MLSLKYFSLTVISKKHLNEEFYHHQQASTLIPSTLYINGSSELFCKEKEEMKAPCQFWVCKSILACDYLIYSFVCADFYIVAS